MKKIAGTLLHTFHHASTYASMELRSIQTGTLTMVSRPENKLPWVEMIRTSQSLLEVAFYVFRNCVAAVSWHLPAYQQDREALDKAGGLIEDMGPPLFRFMDHWSFYHRWPILLDQTRPPQENNGGRVASSEFLFQLQSLAQSLKSVLQLSSDVECLPAMKQIAEVLLITFGHATTSAGMWIISEQTGRLTRTGTDPRKKEPIVKMIRESQSILKVASYVSLNCVDSLSYQMPVKINPVEQEAIDKAWGVIEDIKRTMNGPFKKRWPVPVLQKRVTEVNVSPQNPM
jgi:hypothetical protein